VYVDQALNMTIETPRRVAFLHQVHIFNGLTEAQFGAVAAELTEQSFSPGRVIVKPGASDDNLYLVFSGSVIVTASGIGQFARTLVDGDYFGEESILGRRHPQTATVTAKEETTLLVLSREKFEKLEKQISLLGTNLHVRINSHRLERRVRFKWLQEGEVVYFLARKHSVLLVEAMTGPLFLAFASLAGMIATWYYSLWYPGLAVLWYLSLFAGLGAIAWGVWKGIDWGNDYYIVTDRRIVWVEKMVGLYESRQETPLSAVQRVNVELDLTGRLLDYGDLVIQTIVGSTIKFRKVDHPYQAAALIDQHWKHADELSRKASRKLEAGEMETELRLRLSDDETTRPTAVRGVVEQTEELTNPYEDQRGFANLFRLRFEHSATVTYRKHIVVLLEQTWMPGVIFFALFVLLTVELLTPATSYASIFKADPIFLAFLWAVLYLGAIAWLIYQYVDWSNDIFQVTPDQIRDIDKTPLGQVTSDIASLENILSIQSKRTGLLELLFNYGTVFITIGGGREMHFENVYNPSAVQEDIERRRLEKLAKKEQDTIKAQRERVADWFKVYYDNEQQFRRAGAPSTENNPETTQPAEE
jgi:CRP-like cAMP-binding protein